VGAYRVVDSREGGWYFLGKEPLSSFAKLWNGLVVSLLLAGAGGIGWNAHLSSPEYLANRDLKQARAQLQSGQALNAAELFSRLLPGPVSASARPGLQQSLEQCLQSPSVLTNQGAFRLLSRLGTASPPHAAGPDAFQRGLTLVGQGSRHDPDAACGCSTRWARWTQERLPAGAPHRFAQADRRCPAQQHQSSGRTGLGLRKGGTVEGMSRVAPPLSDQAGLHRGARILGRQLLEEGRYEDAYGLLYPYVQARLTRLHAVERSYTNALGAAYKGALTHLRSARPSAPSTPPNDQASKPGQEEMVEKFVQQ